MMQSNMSKEAAADGVSVLLVSPHPEDHRALANIFAHTNWSMLSAENSSEALRILTTTKVPVVICEYRIGDCSWHELYAHLQDVNAKTRVVVTSRQADDRMWAEILNEGAYDCILKPFHKDEVLRLVSLAWQSWLSATRMQVRVARAAATATSIAC